MRHVKAGKGCESEKRLFRTVKSKEFDTQMRVLYFWSNI